MMHMCKEGVLAALAGGQSCRINKDASVIKALDYSVASIQSCQQFGVPVIRTPQNRFITDLKTDLTPKIKQALALTSEGDGKIEGLDNITAFASDANNLLIRTETQTVCLGLEGSEIQRYPFGSEIKLLGFNWGRGFVRDKNDALFVFSSLKQEQKRVGITNAADIKEIICGRHFTIILMCDGSALMHKMRMRDETFEIDANTQFYPITFPGGVSVAKVRTGVDSIIYISTKGLCYYTDLEGFRTHEPRPLLALKEHKVTDVFISDYSVMVIFGKGQICMLRSPYQRGDLCFRHYLKYGYITGSARPISLSFDGKSIAHAAFTRCSHYIGGRVFFTAIDGSVYTCEIDRDVKYGCWTGPPAPTITRVSYFDQNPVAVPARD